MYSICIYIEFIHQIFVSFGSFFSSVRRILSDHLGLIKIHEDWVFFFYIKRKGSSIKCFPICHPLQYSYPRKQTQRYITTSWLIMEKHTHIHTLSPSCSCNHLTKITVQGNLSGKRAALTSRSTSCKRESNRFPNKLTTLLMLTLRK